MSGGVADAPWSRPLVAPPAVRRRLLPAVWPIVAIFLLQPVWWLLGLAGFVMPVVGLLLLASLLFRRRITAPKGIGLYLLFLLWVGISATQVSDPRQAFSLVYRGGFYLAAGALFLYVFNQRHDELPTATVMKTMATFFGILVIGGWIGMVAPAVTLPTVMKSFVPQGLLNDQFVKDLVSASTSSGRAFRAYPIHRPKAPFTYTNEWGAAFAVTLPFALGALAYIRRKPWRDLLLLLLAVSVFPLVFSLNRGAWLSALGGVVYATLRLARGRNAQLLKAMALGILVVGALLFVSPLGEIIQARITNGYGDAHREELYGQSMELVRASPVFGYGAPVLVEGNLSAGTHGQLWTILVSQGLPGLILFVSWLLWALWKASRPLPPGHPGDRTARFWCEVVIFVAIIQMPYYDLLPWGLAAAMIAAALAWREQMSPAFTPALRPPAPAAPAPLRG